MNPNRSILLILLQAADVTVLAACLVLAGMMATGGADLAHWAAILGKSVPLHEVLLSALYVLFWHIVLRSCGLYRSYRLSASSRELRDLATAVLIGLVPLAVYETLLAQGGTGSAFFASFGAFAFVGLATERRVLRACGRWIRRYGRNLRNVVIVGTGPDALEIAARLARRDDLGYRVVEVLEAAKNGASGRNQGARPLLGRLATLIDQRPIDEVFVALPLQGAHRLTRDIVSLCEEQGIAVRMVAPVASLQWARATVDSVEGQPVLTIHTGPADPIELLAKRVLDVVGASFGLLVLSPVFLVVAVLIKLDSRGPVVFVQERVGLNRRRFFAYKFRSMVDGADRMQAELESLNEADGPVFKIEKDPRVTRVGRWLRKLSIDEFPQLFNVLKGEMSLVGPRPLPLRDVERIDVRWHKRRFSVKPGITCLWQVNSREPKFDEWIRQDMEYIDNWSLALDVKILARTIPAVWSGHGAH